MRRFAFACALAALSSSGCGHDNLPSDGGADFAIAPDLAPSCTDGLRDGDETDVDCGGSCPKCALGRHCSIASDCASGHCIGGLCVEPMPLTLAFAPQSAYPVGAGPSALVAVDATGDGITDLVASDSQGNTISLLPGRADGTFKPSINYPGGGSQPSGIAAGDLDGDGKQDLAFALTGANLVGVLYNQGGGLYADGGRLSGFSAPLAIAISDLDGDGNRDIAAAGMLGVV